MDKTMKRLLSLAIALFLVIVLWGLSNFFINTYYERARSQEVIRTANALETQFRQTEEDAFDSLRPQTQP